MQTLVKNGVKNSLTLVKLNLVINRLLIIISKALPFTTLIREQARAELLYI